GIIGGQLCRPALRRASSAFATIHLSSGIPSFLQRASRVRPGFPRELGGCGNEFSALFGPSERSLPVPSGTRTFQSGGNGLRALSPPSFGGSGVPSGVDVGPGLGAGRGLDPATGELVVAEATLEEADFGDCGASAR